jgi:hypothetical protein
MDVGSLKASCKNKRKETSIFTANQYKPSVTNTPSQDKLHTKHPTRTFCLLSLQEKEAFPNKMGERRLQSV